MALAKGVMENNSNQQQSEPPSGLQKAELDAARQVKYQLCRMILVNAGTNMHTPSGRITAIDPRGGAAVLGDNGVGKTTTLRILPLFFGHLPSQIVAAGHGQEAMIRFVIPTDASAIAFEYQRGSEEENDLRLAVIRRRAEDPDVPFYRLYRSGYRQELFVSDGRFLTDDETQQKATDLGIPTTSKLTTSEYRSVILRVPASSKDKDKLRRYSVDWSFGPKQLDNLDRIVAAMIKKHISFSDIVQVAVGLVQHDLGQGAERARLSFKQGREPIERWLRNREACLDAFGRAPAFEALEDDLREYGAAEARFRSCLADVAALIGARKNEASAIAARLDALSDSRSLQLEAELAKKRELEENAALCSQTAKNAKKMADDAVDLADSFHAGKASEWELLVQELPSLRASLAAAEAQIEAAHAKHQDVTAHYSRLENDAKNRAHQEALALEKSKDPHRIRLSRSLEQIGAAESQALVLCDDELAAKQAAIEVEMEPLLGQRGQWEALKKSPAASEEAQRNLEEAIERLQTVTDDAAVVQQLSDRKRLDHEKALTAFTAQENEVLKAKAAVALAHDDLSIAQAQLSPAPGTLLASLRAHGDALAYRNIARAINPDLLTRQDLDPILVDDGSETLFGWQINTAVISLPEWADESLARKAIGAAQDRVALSESNLRAKIAELEAKGRRLKDLELDVQNTTARASVLTTQRNECRNRVASARDRVEKERKNAVMHADEQLAKINTSLQALKSKRTSLLRDNQAAKQAARQAHEKLRSDARQLCDVALSAINANISKVEVDLTNALARLAQQLKDHLSSNGIDVSRVEALRGEAQRLRDEIRDRDERTPLVERWRAWLADGGPARVEALKSASQGALQASIAAAQQHSGHLLAMQKSAADYDAASAELSKRHRLVKDELETLEDLQQTYSDFGTYEDSVIDPSTPANTLKSRARGLRAELDRLEGSIIKATKTLHQALTTKNSTVKDLVEASLDAAINTSFRDRASTLCGCYKKIGQQVATDINITLKALLSNIGAFHKAIQAFEREVASFNRRLQSGLSDVKCFDRVKDLRLDIVTNFDGLGFYKKLSRMEDVARDHASQIGTNYAQELPSDDTARALAEFMSVLGSDGNVEVNLSQHITLRGSVSDNGRHKEFKRASELESISSEGLTSLVLITLMTALLNTVRGAEPVHVPWVTDEVGKFDPNNFRALMQRLRDNMIDVVTASPELGPTQQAMFAQKYLFEDRGRIREYRPLPLSPQLSAVSSDM